MRGTQIFCVLEDAGVERLILLRDDQLLGFARLFWIGLWVVLVPSFILQLIGIGWYGRWIFPALMFLFPAVIQHRVRSTWAIVAWWLATGGCYLAVGKVSAMFSPRPEVGYADAMRLFILFALGLIVVVACVIGRIGEYVLGFRVVMQNGRICPNCKYDLRGNTSMVCPECGRAFTFEELGVTAAEFAALGDER